MFSLQDQLADKGPYPCCQCWRCSCQLRTMSVSDVLICIPELY